MTNFAFVAMDKDRVVFLVQDDAEGGGDLVIRDLCWVKLGSTKPTRNAGGLTIR